MRFGLRIETDLIYEFVRSNSRRNSAMTCRAKQPKLYCTPICPLQSPANDHGVCVYVYYIYSIYYIYYVFNKLHTTAQSCCQADQSYLLLLLATN